MKKTKSIVCILCALIFCVCGCFNGNSNINSDATVETEDADNTPEFLFENQEKGYYLNEKDKTICFINKENKEASTVLSYKSLLGFEGDTVTYLSVIDDFMFFRVNVNLYRYDMKSQKLTDISATSSDARTIHIAKNEVYFLGRSGTVYKIGTRDESPVPLLTAGNTEGDKSDWNNIYKNFIFVNDVMCYYKRNPDGLFSFVEGESTLIDGDSNIKEFSLFENNDKLYYIAGKNKAYQLFEYNPEEKAVKLLVELEDYSSGGKITDKYFYYYDSKEKEVMIEIKDDSNTLEPGDALVEK